MPVVEVACPGCGGKLKAPENAAGKKARCKKCGQSFRIPGEPSPGDSAGESQSLDVMTVITPLALKDVPTATAVEHEDPFPLPLPKKPALGVGKTQPTAPASAKPVVEALSLDDDPPPQETVPLDVPFEEPPAVAVAANATANPFAFPDLAAPELPAVAPPVRTKRRAEATEPEPRTKKKIRRAKEEPEEPDEPPARRYTRPGEKGSGKTILLTAGVGLLALALGVTAVIVFINQNKELEQTEKKKDEPPPAPPASPDAPKDDGKGKAKNPNPKPKEVPPKPKDPLPKPKEPPPMGRATIEFNPLPRAFTIGPLPAKPQPADRPRGTLELETPAAAIRRVFPPFDLKSAETFVVLQTAAPDKDGKGEKLALDMYSPLRGKVSRLDFAGDGRAVPICDLHMSPRGVRFLAAVDGKLNVWVPDDKEPIVVVSAVDPYATLPDHAKAGLAAAFFSPDPNQVVTVTTAGAIHLFDLSTRKVISEFVPPNGVIGAVMLGRSVARADGGRAVVVAVGGVLYLVRAAAELEVIRKYDLGGDVGRSLSVAASGLGRLLYVFETEKKMKVVLGLPLGTDAKPVLYRWPEKAGEPKGAFWAGESSGAVVVNEGAVWFDDEQGQFRPLLQTQPPTGGHHFGDERLYWYVVPHPSKAGRSMLVSLEMPFSGTDEYLQRFSAGEPLRAVKIDATGLAK